MKEIPLTQGYVALVDDADYDRAMRFKWSVDIYRKDGRVLWTYASRCSRINGKQVHHKLHRFLMDMTDPKIHVDHIDHDGLNCQRLNMRICSHRQNQGNSKPRINNTSGFRGIVKRGNRWIAQLSVQGSKRFSAACRTPEEAARLYDHMAVEHFGEFATLNFK